MTPPPGFYPDANGVLRWWDGRAWTEHVARRESSSAWGWWVAAGVVAVFVLVFGIGLAYPGPEGDELRDSVRDLFVAFGL